MLVRENAIVEGDVPGDIYVLHKGGPRPVSLHADVEGVKPDVVQH